MIFHTIGAPQMREDHYGDCRQIYARAEGMNAMIVGQRVVNDADADGTPAEVHYTFDDRIATAIYSDTAGFARVCTDLGETRDVYVPAYEVVPLKFCKLWPNSSNDSLGTGANNESVYALYPPSAPVADDDTASHVIATQFETQSRTEIDADEDVTLNWATSNIVQREVQVDIQREEADEWRNWRSVTDSDGTLVNANPVWFRQDSAEVTIPSGSFTAGRKYRARVRARDSHQHATDWTGWVEQEFAAPPPEPTGSITLTFVGTTRRLHQSSQQRHPVYKIIYHDNLDFSEQTHFYGVSISTDPSISHFPLVGGVTTNGGSVSISTDTYGWLTSGNDSFAIQGYSTRSPALDASEIEIPQYWRGEYVVGNNEEPGETYTDAYAAFAPTYVDASSTNWDAFNYTHLRNIPEHNNYGSLRVPRFYNSRSRIIANSSPNVPFWVQVPSTAAGMHIYAQEYDADNPDAEESADFTLVTGSGVHSTLRFDITLNSATANVGWAAGVDIGNLIPITGGLRTILFDKADLQPANSAYIYWIRVVNSSGAWLGNTPKCIVRT